MRARFIVGISLVITGTLTAIPVTAQLLGTKPKPGLTVWADADYKGASANFTADTPDISASGLGRAISSLRVGPNESWQVCSEPNYTGNCRTFSAAVANLQTARLNDAIMSVRHAPAPASTGRGTATSPPGATVPPRTSRTERTGTTGLELYPDPNFGGDVQFLREAVSDFRDINFSDRAMSLRVPANQTWEVCNHVDFDDCRLVSGNVADLNSIGFSRVISSARPHPGNNVSGRPQIVFYDNTNYRGRSVIVDEDRQVMNSSGTVGSLRVMGGEWQVCDRPRFYGNCVVVTQDVTDYSRLGLRGPIASARRNQER